ncbi:hypothetical protein HDU96_001406 [Phlyctochytrium bullatum]|nr:hypothetical protein HDU96_001406 [Phlyctochytrium bullatum]
MSATAFLTGAVPSISFTATSNTDLYRRPGKAFSNADVHTVASPHGAFSFTLRTQIPALPAEYQQAGIVLLAAPLSENDRWIKAGVEKWGGKPRMSVVITRGEEGSDWSVAPWGVPASADGGVDFWMRLKRTADGTITIECSYDGTEWYLVRKSYSWDTNPLQIGFMAAAPDNGPSFPMTFSEFKVVSN